MGEQKRKKQKKQKEPKIHPSCDAAPAEEIIQSRRRSIWYHHPTTAIRQDGKEYVWPAGDQINLMRNLKKKKKKTTTTGKSHQRTKQEKKDIHERTQKKSNRYMCVYKKDGCDGKATRTKRSRSAKQSEPSQRTTIIRPQRRSVTESERHPQIKHKKKKRRRRHRIQRSGPRWINEKKKKKEKSRRKWIISKQPRSEKSIRNVVTRGNPKWFSPKWATKRKKERKKQIKKNSDGLHSNWKEKTTFVMEGGNQRNMKTYLVTRTKNPTTGRRQTYGTSPGSWLVLGDDDECGRNPSC